VCCVAGGPRLTTALRGVRLVAPEAVPKGSTVELNCQFDMEGDQLYTVKWYKGRKEFFRYVPKEMPNTKVFPWQGVTVDVSTSDLFFIYDY